MKPTVPTNHSHSPFLPNMCNAQSVFLLVLVAELLAVLITLGTHSLPAFKWDKFVMVSVQMQWIVICSAITLCRLRHWLGRLDAVHAGCVSYAIVLGMTLLLSIIGQWLLYGFSGLIFMSDHTFQFNGWQLLNNLGIAAIIAGILLRYLYLQQQLRNQQQAEMYARIQALQSRIRPHFLFNSMNSIASLIATAPETAERLVEDLSELFRASLAEPTLIPLERELDLCKHYIDIEQLRLGTRLEVEWHISHYDRQQHIPSLMLQPLLENAIFHGIEPLPQGGKITFKVSQNKNHLSIVISNPYPLLKKNMSSDKHPILDQEARHNRMALDNIRHRLTAHYGNRARLSSSAEQGLFTTYIFCPLNH